MLWAQDGGALVKRGHGAPEALLAWLVPWQRLEELCGLPGAQTSQGAGEAEERGTPATQPAPMTQGQAVRGCLPGRVGGLGQPLLGGQRGAREKEGHADRPEGNFVYGSSQMQCKVVFVLFFFNQNK